VENGFVVMYVSFSGEKLFVEPMKVDWESDRPVQTMLTKCSFPSKFYNEQAARNIKRHAIQLYKDTDKGCYDICELQHVAVLF